MLKKYIITSDIDLLKARLQKHHAEYALYRNKETLDYSSQAEKFLEICGKFNGLRAFLHRDFELAAKLNAYGVHLTSMAFDDIKKAKALGLKVIVSTHTKEEVKLAESLGADYVTYSPIFDTPNKGEPKGIEKLEELLRKTDMKVFALGGIVDEKHIKEIQKTKSYGFASIRYFQ